MCHEMRAHPLIFYESKIQTESLNASILTSIFRVHKFWKDRETQQINSTGEETRTKTQHKQHKVFESKGC